MSDDRQNESGGFGVLDDLETEELLDLIRAVSLESEPNTKYLSILSSAYYARPDAIKIDVNAAWENFKQISSGGDFKSAIIAPENQTQTNAVVVCPPQRRHHRFMRVALEATVVAMLLFSLAITAGAFPHIRQAIAHWTEEVFSFEFNSEIDETIPNDPQQENSSYADLQSALLANGITDYLAPQWFPKGYSNNEIIYNSVDAWDKFVAVYENPDGKSIIISIYSYPDVQLNEQGTFFEKSGDEVVEYTVNGIVHYILTNVNNINVVWSYNNYECSIILPNDLPHDIITKIIDSIYER